MAFTVVRYASERYGERRGVATSWLHALCAPFAGGTATDGSGTAPTPAPLRLPIFLRRGGAFGPPDSPATPLLMVGPGTGVAPFRGFLQHRRAQAAGGGGEHGATWLFFGCRREDQDFLYREDLEVGGLCLLFCGSQGKPALVAMRWLLLHGVRSWVWAVQHARPAPRPPSARISCPHPPPQGFAADGTLDRLCVAFSRAQVRRTCVGCTCSCRCMRGCACRGRAEANDAQRLEASAPWQCPAADLQQPALDLPSSLRPSTPPQAHKVYVQHLMQQHAAELHDLIAK